MLESIRHFLHTVYDVEGLIRTGGPLLVCIIVFIETGFFVGFFLPGDSLLVTAGVFAALIVRTAFSYNGWLSPPDPSQNHNIAREAQLDGTTSWFTQSSIFEAWRSTGSLLWVHGKRTSVSHYQPTALVDFRWPCGFIAGSGKSILGYV